MVKETDKTREQLIKEVASLHQRIVDLEQSERELRRTEKALRESEEEFEAIFNDVRDGIALVSMTGKIIKINKRITEVSGYTEKELVGKRFGLLKMANAKSMAKMISAFAKTVAGQQVPHYEVEGYMKTGEKRIGEIYGSLLQKKGKAAGVVVVMRDITARREIENGLEKARKELGATKISEDETSEFAESIINPVREPLIALDQDLRVVSVSRSFYEVFKVKPEETVGQLIYDLGNKQWNIPKLRELLETILPQKATFDNYEVEHDFTTIGKRIMLLNARQIQRVLGKERIILLAIEDITERREIEIGLEKTRKELEATKISEDEAREYAESVINTVREPLISLNQDLRVVSVSRSFYEFFKVNPEETVGQLIYDLGNKQWDIPKLRELLETILPQQTTFDNYEVEPHFATSGRRKM